MTRAPRRSLCPQNTARRAFITMTALHRELFEEEFFKLEDEALKAIIPEMMKTFAEYEGVDTTVAHIIDAFEVTMQKPSDDEAAAAVWSNYKHNSTAKWLLDILSNGAFYFISDAYPGSVTDPVLTKISGFFELLRKGFDVMADKGFNIQEEVEARGCLSWIPPVRRRGQEQGTVEEAEVHTTALLPLQPRTCHRLMRARAPSPLAPRPSPPQETHHIANRRIYVENAVRRIKGACAAT